ncbi:dTDP-4-dehydrorhamnose 3,5-epimerase [Dictyocaulus viviparus]|uniref:dTDP-4-dehydrorhamnose 3,5-epimerase n=1 Tax=Dictyocaulus viviparus TaxID=29172 RepID=A0A0D8XKL0_DICVI|nr:dTDP-4-dehydrorhamnose 3,5-epimerase [Dictyocaulus viviparus]
MSQQQRMKVNIESVENLPDLKVISKKVFPDNRGYFVETYNETEWAEQLNFKEIFKQDNHSFSIYGVLRGLHSQPGMGKLVSVISGEIFDVAVDVRPESPTYGKWHGIILSGTNHLSFWIPDGFAHGFQCLSADGAHVTYKCTDVYNSETEYGIDPLDKDIAVKWPICLSADGAHVTYKCTDVYNSETEYGIDPLDKDIAVKWPIVNKMILSDRDKNHKSFSKYRLK